MGILEHYTNKLYLPPGQPLGARMTRYQVNQNIIVGGSIVDVDDAEHLARDYGVTHVLSVESERDDAGKLAPFKSAARFAFPDNGHPPPPECVLMCIGFLNTAMLSTPRPIIYVHCQAGGSRSPSIAYALLRAQGHDAAQALQLIRTARGDNWGEHPFHLSYRAAVENCFR